MVETTVDYPRPVKQSPHQNLSPRPMPRNCTENVVGLAEKGKMERLVLQVEQWDDQLGLLGGYPLAIDRRCGSYTSNLGPGNSFRVPSTTWTNTTTDLIPPYAPAQIFSRSCSANPVVNQAQGFHITYRQQTFPVWSWVIL